MKIIVTGAHGFIGSAFCRIAGRNFEILPVFRHTNILPKADILVHLAARTAKTKDDSAGLSLYRRDNVGDTKKLLSRLTKKPAYVLYVSTMDVAHIPRTPYAQSKLEAEQVVAEYCTNNHILFSIARLGSVFGPGEGEYQKVIPTFIRAALAARPLTMINPASKRRFIYVDDVAKKLLFFIKNRRTGTLAVEGIKEISVQQLAKRINALIQNGKAHDDFERQLRREIDWFKRRRTLYFDVDGTIINHWKRSYVAYKKASGNSNVVMTEYKKLKRDGTKSPTDITKMESWDLLEKDTLVPGMKKMLSDLSRTHRLIALSARKSQSKLEKQLVNLGIRGYFDRVSTDKANILPGGVLIGDTEAEIATAARLQIPCISVSWGMRSPEFLRRHGAKKIIHRPRDLRIV